jgi:hypothetical protein
MVMAALLSASSLYAIVARMAADTPVSSEPGNGEDKAPPPELKGQGGRRRKLVEGPSESKSEGEFPPPPKIQPEGEMPSIRDAIASMDEEEEEIPPFDPTRLRHSSTLPKGSFHAYPREGDGLIFWMFSVPFGESVKGEAFTQPIATKLLQQARDETKLQFRKFEIRLLGTAGEGFILFEAPLTPMKTADAEETRQSLFDVLTRAEEGWVIAEKKGGRWGTTPGDYNGRVPDQPKPIWELADDTYRNLIIRSMDAPVLMRYRRAQAPVSAKVKAKR